MLKVVIHALRQQAEAAGEPRPSDHVPAPKPPADEPEDLEDSVQPDPEPAVTRDLANATRPASARSTVKPTMARSGAAKPATKPSSAGAKPAAAKAPAAPTPVVKHTSKSAVATKSKK
jgi:hypothetical protein